MKDCLIPLPPLQVQRAIADFLDRKTAAIDALIEKKERLIELLDEKRSALIHRAVTKGLDPEAPMLTAGVLGEWEYPAHWKLLRMKFLKRGPFTYGANEAAVNESPDEPRYLRITDLNDDGTLRQESYKTLPNDLAQPYLLSEGDILFARSGATVGKAVRYRPSWGTCCYAGYLIRMTPDTSLVQPEFVELFSQSPLYWSQVEQSYIQSTIQNVSAQRYGEFLVPVPPLAEQTRILTLAGHVLERIARVTSHLSHSIDELREYRQALITAAVTGQLDIEEPRHDSVEPVQSSGGDHVAAQ